MKGRVYDPLASRFTTADPIMQAPYWSQGMNRYAYVFNDPLNATDPSGFISMSDVVKYTVYGAHIASAGLMAYGSITSGNAATTNFAVVGGLNGGGSALTTPGLLQGQAGSDAKVVNAREVQDGDLFQRPRGPSLFDPGRGALAENTWKPGDIGPPPPPVGDSCPHQVCAPNVGNQVLDETTRQIPDTHETWEAVGQGLFEIGMAVTPIGPERLAIKGFTKHGLNQAISRDGVGVSTKAMLDAVKNPKSIVDQAERGVKYIGEHATVILNKAQKVISTWAHDISSWRIRP
jgi:hypothetical protein